ncbi:hypothetical protein JDV02_008187 [Purpureocillium takamizusanense]|uniref:Uncharacterized protein n=1 Tax=Purpureocillium takamizusanense TaxID=2060973 RepID=A0A9Q8QM74_9HYPO|nr:uncharacterized protein JDV02_008187 [Purpureocillium takamizusanense]UNI22285.1 hypothetical protein JDV02_008187 [Purpureocillium takamizusanense]
MISMQGSSCTGPLSKSTHKRPAWRRFPTLPSLCVFACQRSATAGFVEFEARADRRSANPFAQTPGKRQPAPRRVDKERARLLCLLDTPSITLFHTGGHEP